MANVVYFTAQESDWHRRGIAAIAVANARVKSEALWPDDSEHKMLLRWYDNGRIALESTADGRSTLDAAVDATLRLSEVRSHLVQFGLDGIDFVDAAIAAVAALREKIGVQATTVEIRDLHQQALADAPELVRHRHNHAHGFEEFLKREASSDSASH